MHLGPASLKVEGNDSFLGVLITLIRSLSVVAKWKQYWCISQFQLCPFSPPPPHLPRHKHFFLPWMANSWGQGHLSCQMPSSGDKKGWAGWTLQQLSLFAHSSSAILSIFIYSDFLFQLRSTVRVMTPVRDSYLVVIYLVLNSLLVKIDIKINSVL